MRTTRIEQIREGMGIFKEYGKMMGKGQRSGEQWKMRRRVNIELDDFYLSGMKRKTKGIDNTLRRVEIGGKGSNDRLLGNMENLFAKQRHYKNNKHSFFIKMIFPFIFIIFDHNCPTFSSKSRKLRRFLHFIIFYFSISNFTSQFKKTPNSTSTPNTNSNLPCIPIIPKPPQPIYSSKD